MSSDEENQLQSLLVHAIGSYNVELVEKILETGVDSSAHLHDGTAPLHLAAVLADPAGCAIVALMLNRGADPNVQTSSGLTPLHIAAMWGRLRTVNVLLERGADISVKDDDDLSALDYAEHAEERRCECIDALTRYRGCSLRKFKGVEQCQRAGAIPGSFVFSSAHSLSSSPTGKKFIDNKENLYNGQCGNLHNLPVMNARSFSTGEGENVKTVSSSDLTANQLHGDLYIPQSVTSTLKRPPLTEKEYPHAEASCRTACPSSDSAGSTCASPRSSIGYAGDLSQFHSSEHSSEDSLDETFWSVRSSQPVVSSSRDADPASGSVSPIRFDSLSKTLESDWDSKNFATPVAVPRMKSSTFRGKSPFLKTSSVNRSRQKRHMWRHDLVRSGSHHVSDHSSFDATCRGHDSVHDESLIKNLSSVLKDDVSVNSDLSERYRVSPTLGLACESTIDYSGNAPQPGSGSMRTTNPDNVCIADGHGFGATDYAEDTRRSAEVACASSVIVDRSPVLTYSSLLEVRTSASDEGSDKALRRPTGMMDLETVNIDYDWMDVSLVSASEPNEEPICVPLSILTLTDKELRERLTAVGECPGPVSDVTRSLYQRHLAKIEKNHDRLVKPSEKFKDFPPEMRLELEGGGSSSVSASHQGEELEIEMAYMFVNPEKHTWREGAQKTSFNYLLLDPRVTKNLPERAKDLSFVEQLRCFTAAIFYIGKGKKSRPYEHLHESLKFKTESGKPSQKVNVINSIWDAGFGVVSVHVFHSVIPVEAYTREACMIEAMSLARLCNAKRGDCYGPASSWSGKKKRLLGIHLIQKAMKIFLLEGERQIRPEDLVK